MLLVNTFRELTYLLVPSLCEFYLSLFVHTQNMLPFHPQKQQL